MNVHAKFFHTILFKIQLELKKAPPHTFERKIINSLQLQPNCTCNYQVIL